MIVHHSTAAEQELFGTTPEMEKLRLLEQVVNELQKLNARQDEAFKDMHHELREMKVALYKLTK